MSNFTRRIELIESVGSLQDDRQPANPRVQALTGNAVGLVAIPDRSGYIYVRLNGDTNRTTVARVKEVPPANVWVYVQRLRSGVSGISTSYEVVGLVPGTVLSANVTLNQPIGGNSTVQAALDYLYQQIAALGGGLGAWGQGGFSEYGFGGQISPNRRMTRRAPLQLWPLNGNLDTPGAGDVYWSSNYLAGPATIVWRAGTGLTYKWVQATGTIPQDFARDLVIKARVKVRAGGSDHDLANWQFYFGIYNDGDGEAWNISGPDTLPSTGVSTVWKTLVLKSIPTLPSTTGPGSYMSCNFGIGANSITTTSDIYLGDLWAEYTAAY